VSLGASLPQGASATGAVIMSYSALRRCLELNHEPLTLSSKGQLVGFAARCVSYWGLEAGRFAWLSAMETDWSALTPQGAGATVCPRPDRRWGLPPDPRFPEADGIQPCSPKRPEQPMSLPLASDTKRSWCGCSPTMIQSRRAGSALIEQLACFPITVDA